MSVLFEELNREQIKNIAPTAIAVMPTAATEQHNEHLEMIHDTLHATYMAEQAAKRLHPQVVVATPSLLSASRGVLYYVKIRKSADLGV